MRGVTPAAPSRVDGLITSSRSFLAYRAPAATLPACGASGRPRQPVRQPPATLPPTRRRSWRCGRRRPAAPVGGRDEPLAVPESSSPDRRPRRTPNRRRVSSSKNLFCARWAGLHSLTTLPLLLSLPLPATAHRPALRHPQKVEFLPLPSVVRPRTFWCWPSPSRAGQAVQATSTVSQSGAALPRLFASTFPSVSARVFRARSERASHSATASERHDPATGHGPTPSSPPTATAPQPPPLPPITPPDGRRCAGTRWDSNRGTIQAVVLEPRPRSSSNLKSPPFHSGASSQK